MWISEHQRLQSQQIPSYNDVSKHSSSTKLPFIELISETPNEPRSFMWKGAISHTSENALLYFLIDQKQQMQNIMRWGEPSCKHRNSSSKAPQNSMTYQECQMNQDHYWESKLFLTPVKMLFGLQNILESANAKYSGVVKTLMYTQKQCINSSTKQHYISGIPNEPRSLLRKWAVSDTCEEALLDFVIYWNQQMQNIARRGKPSCKHKVSTSTAPQNCRSFNQYQEYQMN